jgi:aldose 1-epimerase
VVPPSGRQYRIRRGGHAATIVEVGGGIRDYSVDGRPVLDGFAEDEIATGGRGQALLPWPNRIRDGRYSFLGSTQQVPVDEVERSNSIHGLTRWRNWTAADVSESSLTMMLVLHPQPGYPHSLLLSIDYDLSEDGLTVRTRARNVGTLPLPFGAGYHPYLAAAGGLVDELDLTVPASSRLEMDDRQLPTGRTLDVAGSPFDFRAARRVGETRLDTCYTNLERDERGVARVRFGTTTVWMDSRHRCVMVFSGDNLDLPRRRRGLAVEPMTCPPDAFNSGHDLHVLEPRQAFDGRWGIVA